MAAVIATGTSTITGLAFLDRGYESIDKKLMGLGIEVKRVKLPSKIHAEPQVAILK